MVFRRLATCPYAVPNLASIDYGPGKAIYVMRGIGNETGATPLVGVYFDEVPISLRAKAVPDIRTTDLERVEVLKGPQGTTFGQGSVGGTIRFITKNPDFNEFGGNVGLSTYDTKEGGWSEELTGVLNVPVIDDTLAFRIAATYENTAGWIDQPARDAVNNSIDKDNILDRDINDAELSNIRIKGLWQVTDDLSISTMAVQHRTNLGAQSLAGNAVLGISLKDSLSPTPIDPSYERKGTDEHDIYNITARYDFGKVVLTGIASRVNMDNLVDQAGFLTQPAGLLNFLIIDQTNEGKITTQEIRLSSADDNSSSLEWTVGAFQADLKFRNGLGTRVLVSSSGGPVFDIGSGSYVDALRTSKSSAFYGDVSYAINDQWTVGGGARAFKDKRSLLSVASDFKSEDEFDNVSSKIVLSFAVTDDANVYMSASEGFRSGGFNSQNNIVAGGAKSYGPEEVLSYELGAKAFWFNNSLNTEVAVYHSNYVDYQTSSFDAAALVTIVDNAGDAKVKGIEWNIQWATDINLTLGFSGNITETEFTALLPGVSNVNVGDELDGVPKYSYSITTEYNFNWENSAPGFVRLDYNKQGSNSITGRDSGLLASTEPLTFLNAHVGVQWEFLSIELFGKNLLDDTDSSSPSAVAAEAQLRRLSYGIKLNYNF